MKQVRKKTNEGKRISSFALTVNIITNQKMNFFPGNMEET